MMTHSHSAPITVSKDLETSMSTPIRAQPPISVPMIMISVGQLTRRGSTSFGSSIEAAWAARWRTSWSSPRLAPQAPADQRVERWLLQVPQRPFQQVGLQAPGRGIGRSFGADRHRRDRQGPGQVAVELIGRGARRGVAEVRHHDGLGGRVDQQRVPADRAVRDAGPPQNQQLPVQVIQGGVADLGGIRVGQRHPRRQPADQQRVLGRPGRPGLGDLRHGDAGLAGPQGEVGLVLDLLQPGEHQARTRVTVEHEPARLGEQLGVGRIPAVDQDGQAISPARSAYLGGLELGHPPDLPGRRVHVARADAEFLQQ